MRKWARTKEDKNKSKKACTNTLREVKYTRTKRVDFITEANTAILF